MAQDRTYWRMVSDAQITEAARYCSNDLALVLGERLEALSDMEARLEAMTNERDEIDARCDIWKQQAIEALDELEAALRGDK